MSSTKKEFDPLSGVFVDPKKPAEPAPAAGPDPRALAKMLAKAAVAKAGAPTPAPGAAPPPPPAAPPAAAKGLAGAPPPRKTLSAAEALEAARRAEGEEELQRQRRLDDARRIAAEAKARLASAPGRAIPAAVVIEPPPPMPPAGSPLEAAQGLLASRLPGCGYTIASAMYADERKLLAVLWKAHRSRFVATGRVDQALAADAILLATTNLGPRELVAATLVTDKGDWLVWMDLRHHQVIAAFANARAWMSGLEPTA